MDKNLERLNKIYPNGKYVLIPAYVPSQWENRPYDSSYDNKAAVNRWKSNPLSYEEAQKAVSEGMRIGWVVPTGLVVVDVDNKDDPRSQEYLERLLKKFEVKYSYNYSSKGIHILLQDPTHSIKSDSRHKCGINIVIDTRANESGYIVLPCNDPHRAWGEWNDYVEEIPYFLLPLMKENTPSFIDMQNGDGRNDALFKWRTKLEQVNKLTKEQIEKCIRIINENLFAEPMPNQELFKTVLREREKSKDADKIEKENPYNKIADDIVGKFDIISFYDNFYNFNGTYYKPIESLELEKIIHFDVSKNISKAGRKEIIEFLKVKTQVKLEDFDKDWHKIACKNGVLNLVTGEVEPPNKSDVNTICLPWNYNSDPEYSPRIDEFMKDLTNGDPLKMQFLYQVAGYCLLKKNLFAKFFIFKGEGGTGKSTYMNLLQMMVGDKNCSHVSLCDFDKDYYLSTMVSKLVNVDDDVVDGKALENTGRFKSIISGDKISVRQIYREVMDFIPYATCMFSCNRLPRIMDNTSGLYRRMILIELNHKISKPDPLFMNKVTEQDMEYLLFKSVEGIKLAIEEGRFRISTSEEELLNLFRRRQSPINEWLYENDMRIEDFHNKECLPLYNQYVEWCQQNGYGKLMTAFSFKESICALYDMELDRQQVEKRLKQVFVKRGMFDPMYKPF
jgi:putative DNA primase/helicase